MKVRLKNLFEKQYKKLLIIPIALLLLAIIQISVQTAMTGDFVNKGFTIQGGTEVTIDTDQEIDVISLVNELQSKFPDSSLTAVSLRSPYKVGDTNSKNAEALVSEIKDKLGLDDSHVTPKTINERFSSSFFNQAFKALILAFVFMGLVVFLYFRVPVPSIAVILAAVSDIIVTLAIFNILGFKLEAGGIAAFLMLVGYSVDTDILLSSRVLRSKEGTVISRIYSAMKTGFTMTLTTLVAVTVALIISVSFGVTAPITQIMTVLLIGLVVDLINTWLQNAAILRWYVERKHNGKN